MGDKISPDISAYQAYYFLKVPIRQEGLSGSDTYGHVSTTLHCLAQSDALQRTDVLSKARGADYLNQQNVLALGGLAPGENLHVIERTSISDNHTFHRESGAGR